MSDSYRPRDIRLLVERVEKIIDGATYDDSMNTAVKCIAEVMALPAVAEGVHLKGISAEDIEDIQLHLGAYMTITWDLPGEAITGTYYGTRTVGWKYKATYGWLETNGYEGSVFFTLPSGLVNALRPVKDGQQITITYVGRVDRKKSFTVEVAS